MREATRTTQLFLKARAFWSKVNVPPEQNARAAHRRFEKSVGVIEERRRQKKSRAKTPGRPAFMAEPLNERQSRREKAGVYAGTMALAHILKERHGRFGRQRDDATGYLVRMR